MSNELDMLATNHMRTQDVFEAEAVRVERAYIAGYKRALEEMTTLKASLANRDELLDAIAKSCRAAIGPNQEYAFVLSSIELMAETYAAKAPSTETKGGTP